MNERGFTVLEVLITAGVAAIVLMGVSGFYVSAARFVQQSTDQTFVQRQAQLIFDEMTTQIQPASGLAITTCGGVANSLQVTNAGGVYCFRRDSSTGTQFLEDRPGGGQWDLLSGAPVTLSTVAGATLDASNFCGPTAGFCPGRTGVAPGLDPQGKTAFVTLRLRFQIPESNGYQTMTFTTSIARRN